MFLKKLFNEQCEGVRESFSKTDNQLINFVDEVFHSCTQCGKCKEECVFLKEFNVDPKTFAEDLHKQGYRGDPTLLYSCNLCGTCEEICPAAIDLKRLFILLREERIKKGKEPLPGLKWVKERQEWINRGGFFYSKGGKEERECKNAFFPGCTLSGYNPHLVVETYAYLKNQYNPSTGIILNCCGAPFEGLGVKDELTDTLRTIRAQSEEIGASRIIMACPNCYRIFREYLPDYELTTIYEIMEKGGLPETERAGDEHFFLFHSCAIRGEKGIQRAIRNLIEKMGFRVTEEEDAGSKIRCCGMGGMVGITNPILASIIGAERTEGIAHDIVTYCAACRDALVHYQPCIHLLDLVFNPQWREVKESQPLEDQQVRENLTWLRAELERCTI